MNLARPTLYYDGRCGFCARWIPRWRQLTGDRVDYVAVMGDEVDLPVAPEDVREAVHLVTPTATAPSRGAAAVAELGAYTGRLPLFRGLYRRLPGLRPVADRAYAFVARHRVGADRAVRSLVGPDLRRPRQVLVRWLFLRLLALTALCATLSWWAQVDGLVGPHGIAPAGELLSAVRDHAAQQGWSDLERWREVPTLLWLAPGEHGLHLLCALATAGALLLFFNVVPGPALLLLWLGYLSLVTTGGVFMGYQWDALLLEALFAALFLVPWRGVRPGLAPGRAPPWAGVWLARLLVVKLMILSGLVKILSHDPVWADLTALDYHYWTQPLPAPTSWLADHASWSHAPATVLMMLAEDVLPWLALLGLRRLRYLPFWGTVTLMAGIGLTGNYGYFNLLGAALAVTLLDDGALRALVPRRWRARVPDSHAFPHRRPPLRWRVPVAVLAGALVLLSLGRAWLRVDRDAVPDPLRAAAAFVGPLQLTSSYGLFATMTTERPEILIEGSHDGVTWRHYRFAWKPNDDLADGPAFTGPHMPRLDWQLWFAALAGDCRRTRWYPAFLQRLLEGEPAVVDLLAGDPFPEGPPRYIRSTLWYYTFTHPDERARTDRGDVWTRERADHDFCPTVTLMDGSLRMAHPPEPEARRRSISLWALCAPLLLASCSADRVAASDVDSADVAPDTGAGEDADAAVDVAVQDSAPRDTLPTLPDTFTPPDTVVIHDTRFDTVVPPACTDDRECGYCATPKLPGADATCFCPECLPAVVPLADCEANAAALKALCDDRDAAGDLCPTLDCRDPGPVACRDGRCVAVER
jgi:predicted DCC family thiol-disulfide oxidoreductase YuxK